MKGASSYKTYILDGNDCIMSFKKGMKDYDFEKKKSFRYSSDAIFSYYWEKAAVLTFLKREFSGNSDK